MWTRILFAFCGLLVTIGFVALGVWQIERRAWKLDLIARVDERVQAAPVPMPDTSRWSTISERQDAYRRVQASGEYLHSCETPVQALTALGAGSWILTPLKTEAGIVLINRGFVPSERCTSDDPTVRPIGRVTVTGLLRIGEPGGTMLRNNDPAASRWYSRDVAAIARTCGIGAVAPFFIDADAGGNVEGGPVGGLTVVSFRNTHLIYAMTWFALAIMTVVASAMLFRAEFRR